MQQMETSSTSPNLSNFVGLLARLAEAAEKQEPQRPEDDLADDVAHISYESALRAQRGDSGTSPQAGRRGSRFAPTRVPAAPAHTLLADGPRERKGISITIRMSQAEGEQLRERAAEADMTVSAYLRSCLMEVETLRTQVKQALAELRIAPTESRPESKKGRHAVRFWPFARQ